MLKEADMDLENGCYNKAITAYWASIESILRAILLMIRKLPPEKPGKLMSVVQKELRKICPRFGEFANDINEIYIHRRNIEHRSKMADLKLAQSVASKTKKVFGKLKRNR